MESGRQVGPFVVLERLGAGGMGEVFRARDARLNRFVALKFLPEMADDAARERFQREALAIAALNHPHICTLHEIGAHEGRPYLVLELLEGETLRARLRRGGAPATEQLLDWGAQIADALEAAHRKGVLHRDLKPDNIWVLPGGHLKVLDFGLARLSDERPGSEDRTLTSPGMTMGTIPYMSPEQAKGEALDARSDLFSFGSVFYEMATGRPAFPAASAAESIAAILKEQPPRPRAVRPELPPKIEEVADRCLEKDPELRYQSAADLRSELKRLRRETGAISSGTIAAAISKTAPRSHRWIWPAGAVIIVAAGGWWYFRPRAAAPPPRLQFRQLTYSGNVQDAVISPDGKFLAHIDLGPDGTSLHLLSVANGSDVQIVSAGGGCCQSPSFSPDSSAVYFLQHRVLKTVPVLGGALRTVADNACTGAGFSPDGSQIAYVFDDVPRVALVLARADGSELRKLHVTPPASGYTSECWGTPGAPSHAPSWSPDGKWIVLGRSGNNNRGTIEAVRVSDGSPHDWGPNVGFSVTDVAWLPSSQAVVFTATIPQTAAPQAWLLPFPAGNPAALTNDLQGYASASIAADGELALIHAAPQYTLWVQAKKDGPFRSVAGGGSAQDGASGVAWTPDGGLISTRVQSDRTQLWSEHADGSAARPLPTDAIDQLQGPVVASNGQIVVGSGGTSTAVWRLNPDGTGATMLSPESPGAQSILAEIAGDKVIYLLIDKTGNQTLQEIPLAGGTPRQLWNGYAYVDGNPVSPDGKRLFLLASVNKMHQATVLDLATDPVKATVIALDYKTMSPPYAWTPDGAAVTF
ncbi:MAG TPA: protein kinase, partial [Terriglobales bacterium]|nr:protein kinase [Terriglobales bacterium]